MLNALGKGWKVPHLPWGCSSPGRSCPSIRAQLGSGGGGSRKAAGGDGMVGEGLWHILCFSGQMSEATMGH